MPRIRHLLILSLLLAAGCESDPVTLQVGDTAFTESQLLGLSDARLEELTLIAALAESRVRGAESELAAPALERGLRASRIQSLREEVMLEAAGVTEEDLAARYAASPELELEVRHLVILSERWQPDAHRTAAESRARSALERVEAGEPFAEVAGEVSDEPGAERRGGLLEPGRAGTWVPEFWEAARALDEGEVSGIVETEFGFHVLKLESRTELPFSEGRPRVVRAMAAELGGIEGWERWRAEQVAGLTLDREAILGLSLPALPPDASVGVGADEASSPVVLAEWGEGSFTSADLVAALQGGRAAEWERLRGAEGDDRIELVREHAERHRLDAIARERGLEPREEARSRLEREWEQRIVSWTAFLDLPEGLVREEAAERALDGLRSNDQNARIARSELREWAPVLRAAHGISRPNDERP
ncbi:MAG: hypothetical protein EA351_13735 [Gemmatimonadales bacterium]|nr:MAG: hypothetical protein EA351_13735 [Gemmatimonadales bacterium]